MTTAQQIENDLQARCARMVEQEVHCCLSSMVGTLAQGYGGKTPNAELDGLIEQAFELASPIPDYEEAAIQAGYRVVSSTEEIGHFEWVGPDDDREGFFATKAEAWQAACGETLDPYDREVYEHWAISNWLAEKLTAAGEKVDNDFAGLNVWARTTTGQSISMDGVIRGIVEAAGYAGGK